MEPIKNQDSKDLTFKDVVQIVLDFLKYLRSKWLLIVIVCILGFIIGFLIAHFTPKVFTAKTTFILKDDQDAGPSQMTAALSAFGISSGARGQQNYDKIVSIGKSRSIIYDCLLHTLPDSQLIANAYQEEIDFKKDHIIPVVDSFDNLDNPSKNRLNGIYKELLKESLVSVSYEQNSNVLSCSSKSRNADVAYHFNKRHYQAINDYYIEQAIKKYRKNVRDIKVKVDSVKAELDRQLFALAKKTDNSGNIYYSQDKVELLKLQQQVEITGSLYTEVLKNYESASFLLSTVTPSFSILDAQHLPLTGYKPKTYIMGAKVAVVFGFLIVLLLVVQKLYKDILQ